MPETSVAASRVEPIVPPFNWVPPEWSNQKPVLEDVGDLPSSFDNPTPLNCIIPLGPPLTKLHDLGGNYEAVLNRVSTKRDLEKEVDEEAGPDLEKLPHPGSDFSHEEGADEATATGRSTTPAPSAAAAGVANPLGMQRLKLVFEHTLCNVTTCLGQLNAALDDDSQADYMAARKAYMDLLKDLDDHEPPVENQIPGERGYGRSLKWFYVEPLIRDGKIQGAKVVGKWNPHFSSSGIPIPH